MDNYHIFMMLCMTFFIFWKVLFFLFFRQVIIMYVKQAMKFKYPPCRVEVKGLYIA